MEAAKEDTMFRTLLFALTLGVLLAVSQGCATSCAVDPDPTPASLVPEDLVGATEVDADPGSPSVAPDAKPPQEDASVESPARRCDSRLLLTEIMVDPRATADTRGEYIELFNPTSTGVDLRGWQLDDGRHPPHTFASDDPLLIGPRELALIAPSADTYANGGLEPLAVVRSFTLPNSAGLVRLVDPCGNPVVRVRYDTRAPWPRSRPGHALELVSELADSAQPASWRRATSRMASGDRGSPGTAKWLEIRTGSAGR